MITPRDYQKDAINAALEVLNTQDRTQLHMACGSGKSYVSAFIDAELNTKLTIVGVPSLALAEQMYKDWKAAHKDRFKSLIVCSKKELAEKHSVEVTTTVKDIRDFGRRAGKKVIFTTYHSAGMICRAIREVDFIVFDEAHRTAGNSNKHFGMMLHDSNIVATKRLFMTATPRIYEGEDADLVSSMDDEEVYGKVTYTLSFKEAVMLGILTDYKVIVSVSNKRARSGAHQIVANAIKKYKLKKGFTFHSRIRDAEDFASLLTMKGIKAIHANGTTSNRVRNNIISELSLPSHRLVVTNCKLFAEGVNIPSLDFVSFVDSVRSVVFQVQGIGRVMRKAPGKSLGYIIIPAILPKGSVPDALAAGAFASLKSTLDTLASIDGTIYDWIKIKKEGGSAPLPLNVTFDVEDGSDLSNTIIKEVIETEFYNPRAPQVDSQTSFKELKSFVSKHGRLPSPKENIRLYSWMFRVKARKEEPYCGYISEHSAGTPSDRIFIKLKAYVEDHGYLPPTYGAKETECLSKWCWNQLKNNKEPYASYIRNAPRPQSHSDIIFAKVKTFIEENGNLPSKRKGDAHSSWCWLQIKNNVEPYASYLKQYK